MCWIQTIKTHSLFLVGTFHYLLVPMEYPYARIICVFSTGWNKTQLLVVLPISHILGSFCWSYLCLISHFPHLLMHHLSQLVTMVTLAPGRVVYYLRLSQLYIKFKVKGLGFEGLSWNRSVQMANSRWGNMDIWGSLRHKYKYYLV